ncbi:MAG: metallophosphoesterase [Deltaproteobacteria bacterium]|nr:metallophosphoesterase [Deltaproteobacteria bacterium]
MPRALQYVIFLTVVIAVLGGAHTYLWLRLVRDPGLPAPWRAIATWTLVALALLLPATFLLSRILSPATARFVLFAPYVWMGMLVFLAAFFAVGDLVRLGFWATTKLGGWANPLADAARKVPIARFWALGVGGLTVLLTGVAIWGALRAPVVNRVRVELARLPPSLDGTTIAQLSDLHLGPTLQREWLADVVRRVNDLHPDIVAITGDLVDGSVEQLRDVAAPLADLRAPLGVYFITGNHEYYSGVEEWMAEVTRLGIRVLHNERVSVGRDGASFDLAGIDDWSGTGMAPGHGPDLRKALAGRDPARALVLLEHQPRGLDEAEAAGVGLQLSGHTHGGQFWPWKWIVDLVFRYSSGTARHGRTWIHVNEGTGFWGPPLRLCTTPEITLVMLAAPK